MSEIREEQRTLALPPTTRSRILNRLVMRVVDGPDAGRLLEHYQEGTVTVGTASDAELCLKDPTVSSYHLEVRPSERGIQLLDLGSLNGTLVGGVLIRDAVVPVGTRVSVGRTTLVVEDGTRVDVPEPEPAPDYPGLIGASAAIEQVRRAIATLASSSVSLLIQGETGTGKELVAHAIHETGPRRHGPLVTVDCGSLPEALISSQLFGHERGAFTGAERRYQGAFERAHGGTLFLDEIGDLGPSLQGKLLRVLQDREIRPVGGNTSVKVDVRIIAATNRNLRHEIEAGRFRRDLFYRLNVIPIEIPPLRERPEDIPLLASACLRKHADNRAFHLTPAAIERLQRCRWDGNIRELENVIERTIALCEGPEIGPDDLPLPDEPGVAQGLPDGARLLQEALVAPLSLAELEDRYIDEVLEHTHGNKVQAARILGINRRTLYRRGDRRSRENREEAPG